MFNYNLLLYVLSPFIILKLLIYSYKNSIKKSYLSEKLFGHKNKKMIGLDLNFIDVDLSPIISSSLMS